MVRWNPKKAARNARFEASEELREKERERRLQTVIYELGEGVTGVHVDHYKVVARCRELQIFEMSFTTFRDYRDRVLEKYPLPEHESL